MGNKALLKRGVYLRFEDFNASVVVPRGIVWVFLPLTLSFTCVLPAAITLLTIHCLSFSSNIT